MTQVSASPITTYVTISGLQLCPPPYQHTSSSPGLRQCPYDQASELVQEVVLTKK